jgi:hypothetical protein
VLLVNTSKVVLPSLRFAFLRRNARWAKSKFSSRRGDAVPMFHSMALCKGEMELGTLVHNWLVRANRIWKEFIISCIPYCISHWSRDVELARATVN